MYLFIKKKKNQASLEEVSRDQLRVDPFAWSLGRCDRLDGIDNLRERVEKKMPTIGSLSRHVSLRSMSRL